MTFPRVNKKKLMAVAIIHFFLIMLAAVYQCSCQSQRTSRLFPLLSWVIFPNTACPGTNATTGTCMSVSSCRVFGGNNTDIRCASGYGVCCVFLQTCGATLLQNNSYFVNPGYPSSNATEESCIVLIEKLNSNIVQLRLDFEEFDINGVTNRACESDVFQVFGQDSNSIVPSICGMNNGQHIYVDVGTVRGPIMLATTTSGVGNRRWKIRVSQIERTNPSLAPSGCLQYYMGPSGNVMSFNFNSNVVAGQSNFIQNLNYAICIRRDTGYCSIQYTAAPGAFSLAGSNAMVAEDTACNNMLDSLYIPPMRYCGGSETTAVTNFNSNIAGTFRMIFMTLNGIPSQTGPFRGFNLDYRQNLCPTAIQG